MFHAPYGAMLILAFQLQRRWARGEPSLQCTEWPETKRPKSFTREYSDHDGLHSSHRVEHQVFRRMGQYFRREEKESRTVGNYGKVFHR